MSAPAGFDGDAVRRLQSLEARDHFWQRERRRLFCRLLDRLAPRGEAAVDLGCGCGGMLAPLESRYSRVVGVDGHRALLAEARRRAEGAALVEADLCGLPLRERQFNLVTAFDVLEHLDPDALLSEARRVVRPDGTLMLSVPAFSSLWSALDERAGHRCRYTWGQLQMELQRNGWRPEGYTHFQCLLFPLVFVTRRLGPAALRIERTPSRLVDRALGLVNRIEVATFSGLRLPFGSSLVAWARPA
jgi:SAM-dependent methyltransferase